MWGLKIDIFAGSGRHHHGVLRFRRIHAGRAAVAVNAATAGVTALILMLPWMIVSHSIAATFWYPLLGAGTLSRDETAGIVSLGKLVSDGGRVMFLLVPAVIGTYVAWNSPEQQSKRVFYAAVTLCSIALSSCRN